MFVCVLWERECWEEGQECAYLPLYRMHMGVLRNQTFPLVPPHRIYKPEPPRMPQSVGNTVYGFKKTRKGKGLLKHSIYRPNLQDCDDLWRNNLWTKYQRKKTRELGITSQIKVLITNSAPEFNATQIIWKKKEKQIQISQVWIKKKGRGPRFISVSYDCTSWTIIKMNAWSLATRSWNFNLSHQRSGGTFARNKKTALHSVQWEKAWPSWDNKETWLLSSPKWKVNYLVQIKATRKIWYYMKTSVLVGHKDIDKVMSIHLCWPPVIKTWSMDVLLRTFAVARGD